MLDLTETNENEVKARFLFPEGFTGFQGHFPKRPILPAICEIQAVVAMLEAWSGRCVELNEIVLAKFLTPVTPDQELAFFCSLEKNDNHKVLVSAAIVKDGSQIGRLKLRITFRD
jgi:3-hydroxymyristoyl/3-hydroxydecanoyl-(acyl carrier protein) dehydratase